MPCDTVQRTNQTLQQRKKEILQKAEQVASRLAKGSITVKIGPQGAVAFLGLSAEDRAGMTDACIYRRIMAGNSALARAAINRAEQMAGRAVNKQVVGAGVHSHDGGMTWHGKG